MARPGGVDDFCRMVRFKGIHPPWRRWQTYLPRLDATFVRGSERRGRGIQES